MGKISRNGFSLAEAMIIILIGTIALGMSVPMISRQLKNETLTNTQMQILQRQIDQLREQIREQPQEEQTAVESGAIMFFRRTSCPECWSVVKNMGGHYLRIAQVNDAEEIVETKNISDTLEAMVHKHKHISPYVTHNSSAMANAFRYGPYAPSVSTIIGDYEYKNPSGLTYSLSQGRPASAGSSAWFLYTSDGMNRRENLRTANDVLTCPNRDEGDSICKPTGNQYDIPYLSEMPLVGNENRPKSILLLACEKD